MGMGMGRVAKEKEGFLSINPDAFSIPLFSPPSVAIVL